VVTKLRHPGRREQDKTLALQSMRFEHIMQGVRDYAILLIDSQGRIESWNAGAEALLGYGAGEAIGREISFFFTPEDREHHAAETELRQATLNGNATDNRWHMRKDGRRLWVSGLVMRLENDASEHVGYCKIMQDATRLRRLLDELEEKARLLNLAPVMVRNLDHRISYWNEACTRLYGYTREEALGRISYELLKTQHPRPLSDIIQHVLKEGIWQGEIVQTARNGREITMATTWVLNKNEKGDPVSILIANNEITEQKNVEKALRGRTIQLAHANHELERFTAVISHDLQSPLFKISGHASDIAKGLGSRLEEATRKQLKYIESASHRLSDLVKELLEFARAGRAQPHLEQVSMQDVIQDVVDDLSRTYPDARSAVHVQDLPTVEADPLLIYQLIQNLISNALKYRGPDAPVIDITVHERPTEFQFCIRDNGMGIAPENLAKAFDMFQRLNKDPAIAGSGIGLATSKRAVESHGGQITIESKLGAGTAVCFTLPKRMEKPAL
jgi:PAS domain S-box-containing protein